MMHPLSGPRRCFLFLQGLRNTFFANLAGNLTERGHGTWRVNFNGGDRLFWLRRNGLDYRGKSEDWPAFFEARLIEWRVTDLVLVGDGRPLHRPAVRIARSRGVIVHVFEEGYFRPNWITCELDGANGNSTMPRDPAWFQQQARTLPPWTAGVPVRSSFARRSVEDVLYNLASLALTRRFPHYRTHRPWPFYVEYGSWLRRRILKAPINRRRLAHAMHKIKTRPGLYFVFPLQLDSDFQIRAHSPHGHMAPVIDATVASFAAHAPPDALLVVKEHPLDNLLTDWRLLIRGVAARTGVGDRVVYLAGANLDRLLSGSSGVVTINSTVGALALSMQIPIIALGRAIYGLPGLTFQGRLDDFWRQALPPDPEVFDAFRRVIVHRTQINGGFYSAAALRRAVAGAVPRLEGPSSSGQATTACRRRSAGEATRSSAAAFG